MDSQKKLIGAALTFVVLLGVALYVVKERGDSNEVTEDSVPELPTLDRDAITALVITTPVDEGEPVPVRLERDGDHWRVAGPVQADADQSAVNTALDKLMDLEITGIAAQNASSHAQLEVSDDKGIRVQVVAGEETVMTILVGAFRSRNTMVRLAGEDTTLSVSGSIKYAFNKELKDWRNRRVLDEEPSDVVAIRFQSENGDYAFERSDEDAWVQLEPEGAEDYAPIERFGPTKVQSIVSSVARLRAVNFGAEGMSPTDAGFEPPSGTVTVTVQETPEAPEAEEGEEPAAAPPAGPPRTIVLHVGAAHGDERELYLRRVGDDTIYVVSQYLADRLRPSGEDLQAPEPGSEPAATPMMPPGLNLGGGPGGPGGPGGGIPPELMQKIQQQLQQQQAAGS